MTGFIVSTAAVLLTAWIVWAATYRAAFIDGQMASDKQWRAELRNATADDIKYSIARFSSGPVPTGTIDNCADCDAMNAPGGQTKGYALQASPPYEVLAERERQRDAHLHVLRDDEIYGRNG